MVILYERPFALVRLTKAPSNGTLPEKTVIVGLFDYKKKEHEIIRFNDAPFAFLLRFMRR